MEYMYCKYSEAAYVLLLLLLVQIYTILYAFGKSVYAYIFVWETVVSIDGNLFGFRLLAFILKKKNDGAIVEVAWRASQEEGRSMQ